ncbi:MAG: SDR family oxidoreductase, partial [Pseudomonadota bacterium]
QWAVILGGSSGFGLATAKKLARHGMNVLVVHRDRRGAMKRIEPEFDAIRACGHQFVSMNLDALSDDGRQRVIDELRATMGDGRVRLLMHSIAFGNLKPVAPATDDNPAQDAIARLSDALDVPADKLTDAVDTLVADGVDSLHTLQSASYGNTLMDAEDMERTIFSMGTSLLLWVQDLHNAGLFDSDARVLGMTSEGNEVAWKGYAAVAAAKVALESVSRAIAVEFAPHGVRSNIIQAGVTPTPALALIPGSNHMKAVAALRNPFRRTTTPEDVADFIALMCTDEAAWVNGSILRVDGGERIASL